MDGAHVGGRLDAQPVPDFDDPEPVSLSECLGVCPAGFVEGAAAERWLLVGAAHLTLDELNNAHGRLSVASASGSSSPIPSSSGSSVVWAASTPATRTSTARYSRSG